VSGELKIAMVGSINMDLTVSTPRVPKRGENLLAHGLQIGLGGKGANPTVALCRMGVQAVLVGCVGDDDFGHQAVAQLRAEGVDVSGIRILPDVPTCVAVIMVDDEGENTILVVLGANGALSPEMVRAALAPHWDSLRVLLVSFEIPEACVAETVRLGRAHDVPVIVDAGPPRRYGAEIWGKATVLSPNRLEASHLVGYPVDSEARVQQAADDLLAAGPEVVILKLGARGAWLRTRDRAELVPGFKVDVVDTTGAGDAFMAGLARAFAAGRDWPSAVRFANAAGALAVTRLGTMKAMPTLGEIERLLSE